MAILNSNGIVTFSSVPVDAPTTNGPTFGRLTNTNTFYYWNGSAWITKIIGDDTAYDATSWNANLDVPTKNAIRDKFEAVTTSIAAITSVTPLIYKAKVSQAGTADPTATIIYNTLGEVPTYARQGTGEYELGIVAALFTAKTIVNITLLENANTFSTKVEMTANNKVTLYTYTTEVVDDLDGDLFVSIEIYP